MMQPLFRLFGFAALVLPLACAAASANEEATGLPGVTVGNGVVKAAPPPEPDDAPRTSGSGFKVDGWDVRIGGSITYDIGTGNLPPPRH